LEKVLPICFIIKYAWKYRKAYHRSPHLRMLCIVPNINIPTDTIIHPTPKINSGE